MCSCHGGSEIADAISICSSNDWQHLIVELTNLWKPDSSQVINESLNKLCVISKASLFGVLFLNMVEIAWDGDRQVEVKAT